MLLNIYERTYVAGAQLGPEVFSPTMWRESIPYSSHFYEEASPCEEGKVGLGYQARIGVVEDEA